MATSLETSKVLLSLLHIHKEVAIVMAASFLLTDDVLHPSLPFQSSVFTLLARVIQ